MSDLKRTPSASSSSLSTSTPRVPQIVIVGGGYAGLNILNALSYSPDLTASSASSSTTTSTSTPKASITLITPRTYFHYLPASIRMCVTAEGALEDASLLPFQPHHCSGNKRIVNAKVTEIVDGENTTITTTTEGRTEKLPSAESAGYVVLDNGDCVEYDVLILTPGTRWDGIFDFPDTKEEVVSLLQSSREKFRSAQDIVIVGGGSSGAELAGEIKDLDSTKNVTIVHSKSLLMNETYPESWRMKLTQQFADRGVQFVFNDYLDETTIKEGVVCTRSGKAIPADLVVCTRGGRPNTDFVRSLGDDALAPSGCVRVEPTLQLPGHPNILAAGDVIDWNEQKQAAKVYAHAEVVKNNTLVLLGLKQKLADYKGSYEIAIVTNGKDSGMGYFGVLWGISVGGWISRFFKSRDLMLGMVKKNLGFP